MIEVKIWSDLYGDVVLADGRRVSPKTGKACRPDYVRTTYGSGVEAWKDAEITAEELAELSALYVQHLADEAAEKEAAERERLAKEAEAEASPEYQAKRKEAIASVRRFFSAKHVPDDKIPDYIDMSFDKDDIVIALFGE